MAAQLQRTKPLLIADSPRTKVTQRDDRGTGEKGAPVLAEAWTKGLSFHALMLRDPAPDLVKTSSEQKSSCLGGVS
jgi:hypothetical protein